MAARASNGPRVRVAALMLLEGRVVLVRHRRGSARYHLLPGGGVDYRETLEHALVREVAEETGLECIVGRPLIINDTIDPNGSRHVVNITFEATITGGSLTSTPRDDRVEAIETVAPELLSSLDLRPPLAELFRAAATQPTTFQAVYAGSPFVEEQ